MNKVTYSNGDTQTTIDGPVYVVEEKTSPRAQWQPIAYVFHRDFAERIAMLSTGDYPSSTYRVVDPSDQVVWRTPLTPAERDAVADAAATAGMTVEDFLGN